MHIQLNTKKKICLLGSYGVGKTSLVRKFVYNKFEDKYLSTIGVHISKKSISLSSKETTLYDKNVELFIWDIANIEKFDSVVKSYINGAHGAIIVTDITRTNTLDQISEHTNTFLTLNPNAKVVLVGNKKDLVEDNSFDNSIYNSISKKFCTEFIFTSAKTGDNVESVFTQLCEKILKDI